MSAIHGIDPKFIILPSIFAYVKIDGLGDQSFCIDKLSDAQVEDLLERFSQAVRDKVAKMRREEQMMKPPEAQAKFATNKVTQ